VFWNVYQKFSTYSDFDYNLTKKKLIDSLREDSRALVIIRFFFCIIEAEAKQIVDALNMTIYDERL